MLVKLHYPNLAPQTVRPVTVLRRFARARSFVAESRCPLDQGVPLRGTAGGPVQR